MASRGSRQNGGRSESGHTRNREREREREPESLKNASRQPLRRLAGSAADEVKVGGERRRQSRQRRVPVFERTLRTTSTAMGRTTTVHALHTRKHRPIELTTLLPLRSQVHVPKVPTHLDEVSATRSMHEDACTQYIQ